MTQVEEHKILVMSRQWDKCGMRCGNLAAYHVPLIVLLRNAAGRAIGVPTATAQEAPQLKYRRCTLT
jgi:hypothetical protein